MKTFNYNEMIKGWYVGSFTPTALKTNACEVATKFYKAGDYDSKHYHKIATEITHIISGLVEMNGIPHKAGEVIVIEPGEATDFRVIEDTITVVVKVPGAENDKYLV
jgi:quercetin dioxygenase-like cupin family protein